MGFLFRPKSVDMYGALIHLYPQSFQKQYSITMQQTFADMLEEENSKIGKMTIWVRALVDLTQSATKEHVTNGKDIIMNRNTKLLLVGSFIAIIVVGLASFWEGNLNSRKSVGIEKVTAAQLADAMQQDTFYSNFGNAAVLVNGKVESVKIHGNTSLVTFNTGRPYNVVCQFPKSVSYTSGIFISVAAPAGSAERQSNGVLLHNCIEN